MNQWFRLVLDKITFNCLDSLSLLTHALKFFSYQRVIIISKNNIAAIKNYWFGLYFRFIFGKEYCIRFKAAFQFVIFVREIRRVNTSEYCSRHSTLFFQPHTGGTRWIAMERGSHQRGTSIWVLCAVTVNSWLAPMDDTAKGGPTIFWELLTVLPCAPKHLKR